MSEPTRLRRGGSDEVRALLQSAEPARGMTTDERRRTASRIARHASAAAVFGVLSWLPGAAIGAGLGVATVVVAEIVPAWSAHDAPSAPSITAPTANAPRSMGRDLSAASPEAPPPEASPPTEPAAVERSPSRSASAAPPVASEPAAPATDSLAAEAELLERARTALATRPAHALALTEAHAARFPSGMLRMERDIVAIDALRRLGRLREARARAEAMLSRAHGSLYEERVRKLLESMH